MTDWLLGRYTPARTLSVNMPQIYYSSMSQVTRGQWGQRGSLAARMRKPKGGEGNKADINLRQSLAYLACKAPIYIFKEKKEKQSKTNTISALS